MYFKVLLFVNIQLPFLVDGPVTQQQEWLFPKRQVPICRKGVENDFPSALHSLRTPRSKCIMEVILSDITRWNNVVAVKLNEIDRKIFLNASKIKQVVCKELRHSIEWDRLWALT